MADEKLTATVNLDSAQVEASLQRIVAAYLKTKEGAASAGLVGSDAMTKAAAAATETTGAVEGLAGGFKGLSSQVALSTEALAVFGMEAKGAAGSVGLLSEGIESVSRGLGPLLIVGAALAGIAAAVMVFKSAVDAAAESERQMVSVTALIHNQGNTAWKQQSAAVEDLAIHLARTSTFMKSDIVGGMQSMLAYGVPVNDMMRSQAAALDLATAKGISAQEAETSLAMAYDGRVMALKRLGLVTAEEAKNGIEYDTILQRIEQRMGGTSAAALDTFSGKMDNLRNLVDLLREQFGNALLPVLDVFADAMRTGVTAMQPLADQFQTWAKQHLPLLKAGAEGFANAVFRLAQEALPVLQTGVEKLMEKLANLSKDWDKDKVTIEDWMKSLNEAKDAVTGFLNVANGINTWLNETNQDFENSGSVIHDWAVGVGDSIKNAIISFGVWAQFREAPVTTTSPGVGWGAGDGGGDPEFIPHIGHGGQTTPAKAHGGGPPPLPPSTHHHIPGTASGGGKKKAAGSGGGTIVESYQPMDQYAEKITETARLEKLLESNLKDMDASLDGDRAAVQSATTVHAEHVAKLQLEVDTKRELTNASKLLQNAIDAEKAQIGPLNRAHQDAIELYNNQAQAVNVYENILAHQATPATLAQKNTLAELTANAKESYKAIAETSKALAENKANLDKNTASLDANIKKLAEHKIAHAAFLRELDAQKIKNAEILADDKATQGKSLDQQIAYYNQQLALLDANDDENYARIKELNQKIFDLKKKSWDDQIAAQKKAQDQQKADIEQFLNDVIVSHKSFGDIFKGLWDKIVKQFIAQIAQMIVAGNGLKGLFSGLFGGGSSGGSSGGIGGLFSSLFGGSSAGGGSLLSTVPGFGSMPTTSGTGTASSPIVVTASTDTVKALTGSTSGISPFLTSSGAASTMGIFAVLAGAAGIGSVVGGAVGGPGAPNAKENGGIGALLGVGGIIGAQALMTGVGMGPALGALLASGPAGWALLAGGAILGGVAGGLIGPHWGPASNYPDRGPGAADYQSWLTAYNGGPGDIGSQIEGTLTKGSAGLVGQALADYNQLKALGGSNGDIGIANEHDGVFTFGSGMTDTVTDFRTLVDRFKTETAGSASTAATTVWSLTHLAPNFNTARVNQWGTYDPATGATTQNPVAPVPPQIIVNINAPIGYTSQELAQDLQTAQQQNNFYNFRNMRRSV